MGVRILFLQCSHCKRIQVVIQVVPNTVPPTSDHTVNSKKYLKCDSGKGMDVRIHPHPWMGVGRWSQMARGASPEAWLGLELLNCHVGTFSCLCGWVVPASALDQRFHLRTCSPPLSTTQEHFYSNFHCSLLLILFLYCVDHSHEHSCMLLFPPLKKNKTQNSFLASLSLPAPTPLIFFALQQNS